MLTLSYPLPLLIPFPQDLNLGSSLSNMRFRVQFRINCNELFLWKKNIYAHIWQDRTLKPSGFWLCKCANGKVIQKQNVFAYKITKDFYLIIRTVCILKPNQSFGWVVFVISVTFTLFQSYLDFEAEYCPLNSLKLEFVVARPGLEPNTLCSTSQEHNHYIAAAPVKPNTCI